jgi:hypothetical protein
VASAVVDWHTLLHAVVVVVVVDVVVVVAAAVAAVVAAAAVVVAIGKFEIAGPSAVRVAVLAEVVIEVVIVPKEEIQFLFSSVEESQTCSLGK